MSFMPSIPEANQNGIVAIEVFDDHRAPLMTLLRVGHQLGVVAFKFPILTLMLVRTEEAQAGN